MTKHLLLLAIAIGLTACASTRVVPIGPDTYMIQRQGGTGFVGTNSLKMDALEGAGAYCADRGKHLFVVSTSEQPAAAMGRYPSADVQFRCLEKGDPALARPTLAPAPDSRIVIEQK
jgi:putative hemolysin